MTYGMVLRICCALGVLAAVFWHPQVSAATTKIYTPYEIRSELNALKQAAQSAMLKATYETQATTTAGQQVTRYTTRSTLLSKASLGRMAKGALGGPYAIGITAALIAADYIIDPDTGEIVSEIIPWDIDNPANGNCVAHPNLGAHIGLQQCFSEFQAMGVGQWWYPASMQRASSTGVDFMAGNGQKLAGWTCSSCNIPLDAPLSGDTSIATDEQVGDAVSSAPDEALLPNIVNDSVDSGRWPTEWPEAQTEAEKINDTLENDIEGATNPDPDPTIPDSATVNPRPQQQEPTAAEWPLFCDWATVVCDFIDWVKAESDLPDNPELPYIEIEPDDYDSGLPSDGVCPQPQEINLGFGTISVSYDMPCSVASAARPLVIISAYLMAAFILVGGIRQ